jgi:outer membrane lipoprotein-sorting protein
MDMSTILTVILALAPQLSAPAIVARVKQQELRIEDLQASALLQITADGETKTRRFRLSMKREGVNYKALIELEEPRAMAGTKFLIHAERGKRNRQWAYFPDLELVRSIPGESQDDPFLGSDITYADLAGGAHLDDLEHAIVGEEVVDGEACYVMEGTPRHGIVYGKLRGFVRKKDFVNVKAQFFDQDGELMKRAHLSDIRELGDEIFLAHRIEVRAASGDSASVLTLSDTRINQGLAAESFTEEALSRKTP